LIFALENQEIVMFQFINKTPYRYLAWITLILSTLACGATASISTPTIPAMNASATPEATAILQPTNGPSGTSSQNPAPRDETIATADWEFAVVETHRGADAITMLGEASDFNKENPDPAMEYVLVKVHAKYVGTDSGTHHIDNNFFRGMDSTGNLYDKVSTIDVDPPDPSISSFDDLTAVAEVEGWAVIQVRKDDPNIMLVILPRENGLALGEETIRYISLEE
jgi:hypothetical protein